MGKIPQTKGLNTDVLITLGDCSENGSYKYAQEHDIAIANLVEFMDLVESEFKKNLAEVIEESFQIVV